WGPCGLPLMYMEHVPQIPSRQSWSKATGSSPFLIRTALSTSNISRNDISGEMPSSSYVFISPLDEAFFCLQTFSVIFILLITSLFYLNFFTLHLFSLKYLTLALTLILPGRRKRKVIILSQRLPFRRLRLFTKMTAA